MWKRVSFFLIFLFINNTYLEDLVQTGSFLINLFLNSIMLGQVFFYWEETTKVLNAQKSKKRE